MGDANTGRAALEGSRARRQSVVELERLLSIGRRVLLGEDARLLGRTYLLSEGEVAEAVVLARAEERGCLDTSLPLTLEEARLAAGVE